MSTVAQLADEHGISPCPARSINECMERGGRRKEEERRAGLVRLYNWKTEDGFKKLE